MHSRWCNFGAPSWRHSTSLAHVHVALAGPVVGRDHHHTFRVHTSLSVLVWEGEEAGHGGWYKRHNTPWLLQGQALSAEVALPEGKDKPMCAVETLLLIGGDDIVCAI